MMRVLLKDFLDKNMKRDIEAIKKLCSFINNFDGETHTTLSNEVYFKGKLVYKYTKTITCNH